LLKNYDKSKCYIIAEVGGNFCTLDEGKLLVDAALETGVDAIKFQTYKADTVASRLAVFDMENTGKVSQYEIFKKYELSDEIHQDIVEYAKNKKIDWFSTPSHESDVGFLERMDVPAYKIGSDDAANLPFLRYVAKMNKPIFLSTGMCTMQEVSNAVKVIHEEGNNELILLHAITAYPTHPDDVNLLSMLAMQREFAQVPVGYSDHTIGTTACICAAAMGAKVIEKHFTYDKNAEGPDHMLSADMPEMQKIVDEIRLFERMRGDGIKQPSKAESTTRVNNRKSIVAVRFIEKGEVITKELLAVKRPGSGIPPDKLDEISGWFASKDIEADQVLTLEDIVSEP